MQKICKFCGRPIVFPRGTPQNVISPTKYHKKCAEQVRREYQAKWEQGNRRRGRDLNRRYKNQVKTLEGVVSSYRAEVSRLREEPERLDLIEMELEQLFRAVRRLGGKV